MRSTLHRESTLGRSPVGDAIQHIRPRGWPIRANGLLIRRVVFGTGGILGLRFGRSLLSNTTVLVGAELSEPEIHSRQGMTFFLAGAKGRFKGGTQDVGSRTDTDLYNTILQSMGLPASTTFGKPGTFSGVLAI